MSRIVFASAIASAFCVLAVSSPQATAAEKVDFVNDVMPILREHCIGCHTAGDAEGGFVMDDHAGLLAGGDSGTAITPGAAASSRMLQLVSGKATPAMPPESEEPLGPDQIAILTAWIDQGAVGPKGKMPDRKTVNVPNIETAADVRLPVTAVAISGDLQAISRFGSVEIRRQNQTVVQRIGNLPGKVNSIEFSDSNAKILIGSGVTGAYGRAAIYDIESGDLVREFFGHRDTLYAATFSPNEQLVATAGYDRKINLWNVASGEKIHTLTGHNGAIFDLCFSPDGKVIVSACADETAKVWSVKSGERLDTLSQCEGEALAVVVTRDGEHVIVASADNRIRSWRLVSMDKPQINPLLATRFVDETPLTHMATTSDGKRLVVLSEAGNLKILDTNSLGQTNVLAPVGETASDLAITADDSAVLISLMDGRIIRRELPDPEKAEPNGNETAQKRWLEPQGLKQFLESELRGEAGSEATVDVARFSQIDGVIDASAQTDRYRWEAKAGEVWAVDVDAVGKSKIDPVVTIVDLSGKPVLRARLQAVRDSYFTFRGKDSKQVNDFRMFAWQEMDLDDYLYAAGEVTKLWMHPRGPDSGFNVYPGEGTRWTYFGTTHVTHALGEPAYIVRPLANGQSPVSNGLPVFDLYFQNDDDPSRVAGKNSRLIFTAPDDGSYTAVVTDTRGEGGSEYGYQLKIRAAQPDFKPSVAAINKPIPRGGGREFTVRVNRMDEFDGPVTFDLASIPDGLVANTPLTIEAGQRYATGVIWADPSAREIDGELQLDLTATATINGKDISKPAGSVGKISLADPPQTKLSIQPSGKDVPWNETWALRVKRGSTVTARVVLDRSEKFNAEVSLGKENSGRNTTHGVYVDNIGLNGLLVLKGASERVFFLTADHTAAPGKRSFFLTANIDGGVTSYPITVEVLP